MDRRARSHDLRPLAAATRGGVGYHRVFKYNLKRLSTHPDLPGLVRELSARRGVVGTVELDLCKHGGDAASALRNPLGIAPNGPAIDLTRPHGRERMSRHAV
jgi:putative glutathione S-transferase